LPNVVVLYQKVVVLTLPVLKFFENHKLGGIVLKKNLDKYGNDLQKTDGLEDIQRIVLIVCDNPKEVHITHPFVRIMFWGEGWSKDFPSFEDYWLVRRIYLYDKSDEVIISRCPLCEDLEEQW
jgi:hypothetical protein